MNSKFGTRRTVQLVWRRYLACPYDHIDAYVRVRAGVYKIAVNLVNGKKQVVYVGQAADLDDRLKGHLSEWESNDELSAVLHEYECSFAFAVLPLQADRDAAERALYFHFRPLCNQQTPSSPASMVTPLVSR